MVCLSSKVSLGYLEGNFEDYEVVLDWDGSELSCKDYIERGIYGVTVIAREKTEQIGWSGKPFKTIIAWKHIAKQDIVNNRISQNERNFNFGFHTFRKQEDTSCRIF